MEVMDWLFSISGVPKHNLSFIITTSEDTFMELVVAHIFDLFFMMVEVAKRMNSIIFFFCGDVPKR